MPQKKNQTNGFWLFAQSNKGKWRAQGLQVSKNDDLLRIASPLWKNLMPDEKKKWDAKAKGERKQNAGDGRDDRLDCYGKRIQDRVDHEEEARKRRDADLTAITSKWQGKDLTRERFYFINFQEMLELTEKDSTVNREWLPREMAILEYSLQQGIIQHYHQFIWPDGIPMGCRYRAEQFCQEVHQIPPERMEEDSDRFHDIWSKMLKVVHAGVKNGEYPPLYCLATDYLKMKYLIDWLWVKSGSDLTRPNPLGKVVSTEDMVARLLAFSGQSGTENISVSLITSRLDSSQWDYTPNTACRFHMEKDISRHCALAVVRRSVCRFHMEKDISRHCALAVVRRTVYTISDMVGQHYNIVLSEKHVPVRDEEDVPGVARILPPNTLPMYKPRFSGRGRGRPQQQQPGSRPQDKNRYRVSDEEDDEEDDSFTVKGQGQSGVGRREVDTSSNWSKSSRAETSTDCGEDSLTSSMMEFGLDSSSEWSAGQSSALDTSARSRVNAPPGFNALGPRSALRGPAGRGVTVGEPVPVSAVRPGLVPAGPLAAGNIRPSVGRGVAPQRGRGSLPPRGAPPAMGGAGTRAPPPLGGAGSRAPPPLGGAGTRAPPPMGGAESRAPPPMGGAESRAPPLMGGAESRAPPPMGGAESRAPPSMGGFESRAPPPMCVGRGTPIASVAPRVGRGHMVGGAGETYAPGRSVGRGRLPPGQESAPPPAVGRGARLMSPSSGSRNSDHDVFSVMSQQTQRSSGAVASLLTDSDDDFVPLDRSVTERTVAQVEGGGVSESLRVGRGFNPSRGRGYAPGLGAGPQVGRGVALMGSGIAPMGRGMGIMAQVGRGIGRGAYIPLDGRGDADPVD